jgi:hypothetical protein
MQRQRDPCQFESREVSLCMLAHARSSSDIDVASSRMPSSSRVIRVDVEALASGKSHMYSDRAPCWAALVNDARPGTQTYLDLKMKPAKVVDYLSDLSGVDETSLRHAVSVPEALKRVQAKLGPDVTLVGWNVQGDIDWLQLRQGVHYKEAIDCIGWFTHMQRRADGKQFLRRYSLAHVSRVLLGSEVRSDTNSHSPVNDAIATLRLYEKYKDHRCGSVLQDAISKVRNTPIAYRHTRTNAPTATSMCMAS